MNRDIGRLDLRKPLAKPEKPLVFVPSQDGESSGAGLHLCALVGASPCLSRSPQIQLIRAIPSRVS